jgi:hypothetical protein
MAMKRGLRFPGIVLCVLAWSCQSPTSPAPANGYAGQWSGTTVQGRPIAFTISPDELVTTITLGHDFNGCSGSQTFSNLSLKIAPQVECIPGPCPASLLSYRAFGYGSGNRIDGPSTSVNALFLSTARAEGTVNLRGFPGCGDAIGVSWSANRR